MPWRYTWPFTAIPSTEPSFNVGSTAVLGSTTVALESTGVREWGVRATRTVRIASGDAADFNIAFGDSNIVATSSGSIQVLGGTVETFNLKPSHTHIAVLSTGGAVNVTLGAGE